MSAVIGSVYFSPVAALLLFYGVAVFSLFEFFNGLKKNGYQPDRVTGIIVGSFVYLLVSLAGLKLIGSNFLTALLLVLPAVAVSELFRNLQSPFVNIGLTLTGILYIPLSLGLLLFLYYPVSSEMDPNPRVLVSVFALVWVNDSMAYVVGSLIGKHRLFERISPKKSWEGSVGGLLFTMLAGYLIYLWAGMLSWEAWMFISIIVVILGTLGDLAESMLKRSLNIKDSGTFFPGHGGFLDRFDAVLMVTPAIVVFIIILNWFAQ